jgi:hypothetical protein
LAREALCRDADVLLPLAVLCGDPGGRRQLLTVLGRLFNRGLSDAGQWRQRVLEEHFEQLAPEAIDLSVADPALAAWFEGYLLHGASAAECRRVERVLVHHSRSRSVPLQSLGVTAGERALKALRDAKPTRSCDG